MKLTIKLQPGKTLEDAARKMQMFNYVASALLVNGPIQCNPDSYTEERTGNFQLAFEEDGVTPIFVEENGQIVQKKIWETVRVPVIEGFLGSCNSYPNEFGYVTVDVPNYRKLFMKSQMVAFLEDTFEIVTGEAVEDKILEDGTVIQVYGGTIQ